MSNSEQITLEQDAGSKLKVTLSKHVVECRLGSFFNWRKNLTVERLNKLGTADRDKYIQHLYEKFVVNQSSHIPAWM